MSRKLALALGALLLLPGFLIHRGGGGGAGGGGGSTNLATLTVLNSSGSTQAAGAVTPIFGWGFKCGDIPAGTAPQFKNGSGTVQPMSWGWQVWNCADGSLRYASFMLRLTDSIAASGTLSLSVWSGGSAPATSARTLTEVYAQSMQVNGTGPGSWAALTGAMNAYLKSDANNLAQAVYMDGAAGKVWRIDTAMAPTSGGTADGQLETWWYVAALTDASGNLGGYRVLPRVVQPYYNVSSPAPSWRGFSSLNWQWGSTPTTVNLTFPWSAQTFSWSSGSNFTMTNAGTYYEGAGDGVNWVPGFLTTTGTLPTGLSTNTIYYAATTCTNGNTPCPGITTTINLMSGTIGGATFTSATASGSGTHTFNPMPVVLQFGSIFMADSNGRMSYIQGTGSTATDPASAGTLRINFDQTYEHKTGLFPPYNLSFQGVTKGGTIVDTSFSYSWNPWSVGPLAAWTRGAPGLVINNGIGPLSGYAAQYFYNQSATGELVLRALGYAQSFEGNATFLDRTTRVFPNFSNSSYTGMAAPSGAQQTISLAYSTNYGFTAPTGVNMFLFGQQNGTHRPSLAYAAALWLGEPQFLDLLQEGFQSAMMEIPSGCAPPCAASSRNPTIPSQGYGIASLWVAAAAGLRANAWPNRDIQYAALLAPATDPHGTGLSTYITAIADATANAITGIFTSTYYNSWALTNGVWDPININNVSYPVGTVYSDYAQGFMGYYNDTAMGVAALRGNAAALTYLQDHATFYNHILTTFGGWHIYGEYYHTVNMGTDANGNGAMITADSGLGFYLPCNTLTWTTGARAFTCANAGTPPGWTPALNDKIIFDPSMALPAGFAGETPYYFVNVSGNAFDLSTSLGGGVKTPTSGGSFTNQSGASGGSAGPWFISTSPPAASTGFGNNPGAFTALEGYGVEFHTAAAYMNIAGVTGMSSLISDCETRLSVSGLSLTTDPTWLVQTTQ